MADTPFEIPQQMRDLAEQNIKQAHAAYEQLTDFVTKAIDAWMGAMPSNGPGHRIQGCARPRCGNREEECRTQLSRWSKRSPRHRISRRF